MASEKPQQVVCCPEPVFQFGSINPLQHDRVDHVFRIENHLLEPVEIKQVKASCGCLTAEKDTQVIEAQGFINFPMSVQIAGPPGPFRKSTSVIFASPAIDPIVLEFAGELEATPQMLSYPGQIKFGDIIGQEEKHRRVKLTRYDGSDPSVQSVSCTSTELLAVVLPESNRDAVWLDVSVAPGIRAEGDYRGEVHVLTSPRDGIEFTIPVQWRRSIDRRGMQKEIYIQSLSLNTPLDVLLTAETDAIMDFKSIHIDDNPDLQIELSADAKKVGTWAQITRLKPVVKPQIMSGNICVGTMSGETINIRLTAFCDDSAVKQIP